ncbi:12471_t:CDS:1, partial [Funneliformis caledonium]
YYRQQQWEREFIDDALKIVSDTYNKYYRDNSLVANNPAQDQNKSNFFGLFEIGNDSSDEDELEEYLRKPVVNFKTNPLQ